MAEYLNVERSALSRELARMKEDGFDVLPEEDEYPRIMHQQHSVIMARVAFGVTDLAVLSAIGCHTTLKAGASQLDKVVFLADKLSWDQAGEAPFKETVNEALSKSLDAACLAYISWLLGPEGEVRVVHPWLKAAFEELGKRGNLKS